MEKRIKIAGYQPEGSILSQSLNIFGRSLANENPDIKTEFTFNIMDIGKAPEEIIKLVSDGVYDCLLYTSPSPRDISGSRMPSSA